METYSYRAIAANGKEKKGSVAADSVAEATAILKQQGMVPISVGTQSALDKEINLPGMGGKVKLRDLCVFCRQFSSILKSGVSVISALNMLAEQTENKNLKKSLKNVQSAVEKGDTLSSAMRAEGKKVFPPLLVSMVEAGEASGSLEDVFERMAIQFEKDNKIKGMVTQAMIYPCVLVVVMIAIVIIMMIAVIPQFTSMFDELGSELPIFTKLVVMLSDFIVAKWWLLIIIVVAVAVAFMLFKSTDKGKHVLDSIALKIPIFGKLQVKTACARFTRILSTLVSAGMPLMDALEISAGTMTNVIYKDAIMNIKNGVALGMELSDQLRVAKIFPPMVVHMTGIGEETGNLEGMLVSIANYYDEEVENATKQMTSLMEPIIIVVMAVVVGGLVAAIYGPMITLYSTLGG